MQISHQHNPSRQDRSDGFTPIELLVVLGVLFVLIALLMTGVNRVISANHTAKCVSNLRSIGSAMSQYMLEHHYGPPDVNAAFWEKGGQITRKASWAWMTHLAPYLGSPDHEGPMSPVFDCPADPNVKQWPKNRLYISIEPGDNSNKLCSYGYNYIFFTTKRSSWDPLNPRPPIHTVRNPSSIIIVTDGSKEGGYVVLPENYGNHHSPHPSLRHSGKFNAVFLDGHVESMDAKAAEKDRPYWKPLYQ